MTNHNEIKKDLLTKRTQILNRIHLLDKDSSTPLESDWDDQAISLENAEVLGKLDDLSRKELKSIEDALKKIEIGSYGVCSKCGEMIPDKRLKALPYTALCMTCSP